MGLICDKVDDAVLIPVLPSPTVKIPATGDGIVILPHTPGFELSNDRRTDASCSSGEREPLLQPNSIRNRIHWN